MKIILTLGEIKDMVAAHLGIHTTFELEIEKIEDRIAPIIAVFEKVKRTWDTGEKIVAIKELRTLAPRYGLWQAKAVLENYDTAVALVKLCGSWPMPTRSPNGEVASWAQEG